MATSSAAIRDSAVIVARHAELKRHSTVRTGQVYAGDAAPPGPSTHRRDSDANRSPTLLGSAERV
jgi:hypothetical protein